MTVMKVMVTMLVLTMLTKRWEMITFPLAFLFGSFFFCQYFHHFLFSLQADHCLSKHFRFKNLQLTQDLQKNKSKLKSLSAKVSGPVRSLDSPKWKLIEGPWLCLLLVHKWKFRKEWALPQHMWDGCVAAAMKICRAYDPGCNVCAPLIPSDSFKSSLGRQWDSGVDILFPLDPLPVEMAGLE